MKNKIWVYPIIFALVTLLSLTVAFAHSGGTDTNGGHYNSENGDYHYHHGHSAHNHYYIGEDMIEICPYNIFNYIFYSLVFTVVIEVTLCPLIINLIDIFKNKKLQIAFSILIFLSIAVILFIIFFNNEVVF